MNIVRIASAPSSCQRIELISSAHREYGNPSTDNKQREPRRARADDFLQIVCVRGFTPLARNAVRHAVESERMFQTAPGTTSVVVSEMEHELRDTAGTRDVRERLLRNAYAELESLARRPPEDSKRRAELAEVYARVSSVALSLGEVDRAQEDRVEALKIRRGLVEVRPDGDELQTALSISIVLGGDVAKHRSQAP